jgi:hypothetical protein
MERPPGVYDKEKEKPPGRNECPLEASFSNPSSGSLS